MQTRQNSGRLRGESGRLVEKRENGGEPGRSGECRGDSGRRTGRGSGIRRGGRRSIDVLTSMMQNYRTGRNGDKMVTIGVSDVK